MGLWPAASVYTGGMAEADEPNKDERPVGGTATMLLARLNKGDSQAAADLLPLVYGQLRAIAGAKFRGVRANHTLQPTALVHEAYLKLVVGEDSWENRAHFCAVAATAMRQILLNHARDKQAAKRDGNAVDLSVDGLAAPSGTSTLDLVILNDTLERLAELNEQHARIVELRFLAGSTVEQVAHVLGMSTRTVEREWRLIRAWLARELRGEAD